MIEMIKVYVFSQVTVTLQTNCSGVVPVGLVLVSDQPVMWDLKYGSNIYLMQGYVSNDLLFL